jgi:FkbM family methyltransferase
MRTSFKYNNIDFEVEYNENDSSGLGSIREIVTNNEYILNKFVNQIGKVFIDIGANIGIATIIMAKLNPESIVYTFEPFKEVYELLIKNIELNNLTNVRAFNMAVTDKNGYMELLVNKTMSGANTIYSNKNNFNNAYFNTDIQLIETISLDEFLNKNNIYEIYLFKIDCEGSEYDIIYGSELFKHNIVKNMVGEFHDLKCFVNTNKNSTDLIKYCHEYVENKVKISTLDLRNQY